jgi:aminopeptidase
MESSQVSIFAVVAQKNELRTRMQMTDVVNRRHMRHAHMVNIEPRIMLEGHARRLRTRWTELSRRSGDRHRATQFALRTAAGTDIVAEMNPGYKWFKTSGIISQNKWGNLPGGEASHARRSERHFS